MVLSSVMLSPWPSSHAGSAATATTRSVSVGRLPGPEHSEHAAENSVQNTLTRPAASCCWTTCGELSPRPALGRHQRQQRQKSEGEAPHLLQLQINTFTVYSLQLSVNQLLLFSLTLTQVWSQNLRYYHRSYLSDYIRRTLKSLCAVAKDSVSHKQ